MNYTASMVGRSLKATRAHDPDVERPRLEKGEVVFALRVDPDNNEYLVLRGKSGSYLCEDADDFVPLNIFELAEQCITTEPS